MHNSTFSIPLMILYSRQIVYRPDCIQLTQLQVDQLRIEKDKLNNLRKESELERDRLERQQTVEARKREDHAKKMALSVAANEQAWPALKMGGSQPGTPGVGGGSGKSTAPGTPTGMGSIPPNTSVPISITLSL